MVSHRGGPGSRSGHVGFVVYKVALRQVFSEYFGFPCQFSFRRLLHTHHLSSGAGAIGQFRGRRTTWTQSHPTSRHKKKLRKANKLSARHADCGGKNSSCPLDIKLGGPQSQASTRWREGNYYRLLRIEPSSTILSLLLILTTPSW
jgi:hypothetical protein